MLLHGIGLRWQTCEPVIARLARDFDVIACDSPGFGGSAPLADGIEPTIPAYADAFEWFFAELGLERPHVAGNSMGGAIALELARRRAVALGDRVLAGRLLDAGRAALLPALARGARADTARRAPGAAKRSRARARAHRRCLWQTFGYPDAAARRGGGRDPARRLGRARVRRRAGGVRRLHASRPEQLRETPVTIAWGKRDRLLPYRLQAPRARELLPRATHVTLGAGTCRSTTIRRPSPRRSAPARLATRASRAANNSR